MSYTSEFFDFPEGSRLPFYTDGLTEVFRDNDEESEEFGPNASSNISEAALITIATPSSIQCGELLRLSRAKCRPGYERCFEPSNFCATSFWNQPRIVSGLATSATFASPCRPSLFPISANVERCYGEP